MPISFQRWSFVRKIGVAMLLVTVAQWLFYGQEIGSTLGGFGLIWCVGMVAAVPAVRRLAPASALGFAALIALMLIDDPNPLGWTLFWTAVSTAALLPRHRFDDAATWGVRLISYAGFGLLSPVRDLRKLMRQRSTGGVSGSSIVALLALPLIGGTLFFLLFAVANPVIGSAISAVSPPSFWDALFHLLFWSVVLAGVWPSLRPRAARITNGLVRESERVIDLPVATLVLSLVAFNAVFALQNILDIVFLWNGAALPEGVTLAEYAHRGAYTLIATALIAGAFVLIALAPGAKAAQSSSVRRLLVFWIAQNILLVASSILRLIDYIAAYSLTELRIAALAWMGLVATGLAFICWRLLSARSAAWLVNANAISAGIVLLAITIVDLGAVAARWNVDHARRADQLDLCYLNVLGASALLPLIDLERRAGGPALRDRARYLRREIQQAVAVQQSDWHSWTWRDARRLAAARALVGRDALPVKPAPFGRDCAGAIQPPPPPLAETAPAPAAPLPVTNLTDAVAQ